MREVPTSLLDKTTVVDVLTTRTIIALTTATIEKVGTGGVTVAMTSWGKHPRDHDHEVNTVKRPNGRRDYQEDYNTTL